MKTITEYEIINHGVHHEQYFQGCGTAFTAFDDVATGIGCSESQALDDALDNLAQNDWDTENTDINADCDRADTKDVLDDDMEDAWVYISVRVK